MLVGMWPCGGFLSSKMRGNMKGDSGRIYLMRFKQKPLSIVLEKGFQMLLLYIVMG